jgi:hypothetical protein
MSSVFKFICQCQQPSLARLWSTVHQSLLSIGEPEKMKPTLAAEERKHFCARSARSLLQLKFSEVKQENSIVVNFVLKYYLALLIFFDRFSIWKVYLGRKKMVIEIVQTFSSYFIFQESLWNYTNNAITTQGTVFGVFQALYFRRPAQGSSRLFLILLEWFTF